MKKTLIIISVIVLTLFFTGCKCVNYKELYYNDEIEIIDAIEEKEIQEKVKLALDNLKNQNKLELHTYMENDGTSFESILKYDKAKQELIYESKTTENDIVNYELKVYIVDGYRYEYFKSRKTSEEDWQEKKEKFKLYLENVSFETIIVPYFVRISYDLIFNDHIIQFGHYEYGMDNYGNTVLLFNQEKELPTFINYCQTLVIEKNMITFYTYQWSSSFEVCEFKYKNVDISFPKLEGYEYIGEE